MRSPQHLGDHLNFLLHGTTVACFGESIALLGIIATQYAESSIWGIPAKSYLLFIYIYIYIVERGVITTSTMLTYVFWLWRKYHPLCRSTIQNIYYKLYVKKNPFRCYLMTDTRSIFRRSFNNSITQALCKWWRWWKLRPMISMGISSLQLFFPMKLISCSQKLLLV